MTRPVTLFTGQFADIPIAELAAKAAGWGYDGLELACWGDHLEVAQRDGLPIASQIEWTGGRGSD